MQHHYEIEVDTAPEPALSAISDAAELWGAEWHRLGTGGRIELPVMAGLRLGLVRGEIATERRRRATRLVLHVQESHYRMRIAHLVVLLFGALGGGILLAVPFYPALLGLLPISGLLLLLAWFLVASRLRHSDPSEFLGLVKEMAEGEGADDAQELAGELPDSPR